MECFDGVEVNQDGPMREFLPGNLFRIDPGPDGPLRFSRQLYRLGDFNKLSFIIFFCASHRISHFLQSHLYNKIYNVKCQEKNAIKKIYFIFCSFFDNETLYIYIGTKEYDKL